MTAPDPTPRLRRKRRWWLRVPLIVGGLVITTVVLTQAFLWTDYPRQIAEAQVSRILGVGAKVERVRIGWLGHTRIEGVSLTLPMQATPFIHIDAIDATHTSLPLIAFSQSVSDVAIRGVKLDVVQDASGRWNLQALVPPSSGSSTQSSGNPLAQLPDVSLADVHVTITRADGRQLSIDPVGGSLRRRDAVSADLMANVEGWLKADGQLGLVRAMPQEVRLQLAHIPADVQTFLGTTMPTDTSLDATWRGRKTADGVAGTMQIARAHHPQGDASGRVDVTIARDATIAPVDLQLDLVSLVKGQLSAGQIVIGDRVSIESLRGTLNGGRLAVGGAVDPRTLIGNVDVVWEEVTRDTLKTSGQLKLATMRSLAGRLQLDASAQATLDLPGGAGTGALRITGEGDSLDTFTADLRTEPITFTRPGETALALPPLLGQIVGTRNSVSLSDVRFADASAGQIGVYGALNRNDKTWWTTFDATQLQLPALARAGVKGPIDVGLAAYGQGGRADATRLYAKLDRGTLWARGSYDTALPRPLHLETWAWYDKPVTEDNAAQLNTLNAVGTIDGTFVPRDLEAGMDVSGSELVIGGRAIGDVTVRVNAKVGEDAASLRSEELELLGGKWRLRGEWSRASGKPPAIGLDFRDIPADRIGKLVDQPDLAGTIDKGVARIVLRSTRLDQIDATARASGKDLSFGPFKADTLEADLTLKDGTFTATPTLRNGDGEINATLSGRIERDQPVKADVTLRDWPAPQLKRVLADGREEIFQPRMSGKVSATIAPDDLQADVALNGGLTRDAESLATFDVDAALVRKRLTIRNADIQTLDGNIAAKGEIELTAPNATTLDVTFDELTPSRLAWLNPVIQEVQGTIGGTLSVHPATTPRPLGPLQIELALRPSASSFRGVSIGDMDVNAFADYLDPTHFRIVTDRSELHVADGSIQPFARLTRDGPGTTSQLINVSFSDLDLLQLGRAIDNDGKDLTGRVAGSVQLYGRATNLAALNGDANINVTQSDLANFGPVAALYNALSIGTAGSEPSGTGSVRLRVAEGVLNIEDANYFNRGVYASGFGTVRDLDQLPESPLDLMVFGSLQPLRAVKLPFFGDLNDTLSALQSSVTAIQATGTLKSPQARQVALSNLGEDLQKVLLGKVAEKK